MMMERGTRQVTILFSQKIKEIKDRDRLSAMPKTRYLVKEWKTKGERERERERENVDCVSST